MIIRTFIFMVFAIITRWKNVLENHLRRYLCPLVIFFMIILIFKPVMVDASENHLQWIDSDESYSYFLDPSTITMHRNYNNKVDYVDAWIKITYSGEGAQTELDDWNVHGVSVGALQNGYGEYRVRINFIPGTVDVLFVSLNSNDGRTLYTKNNAETIRVAERGFYQPIYTYMVSYLAGTPDFSFYKSWKSVFWYKSLDKNGQLSKTFISKWKIRQENQIIYYSQNIYTYAPDNTVMKEDIAYCELNIVSNTITFRGIATDKNNDDTWAYQAITDKVGNNSNIIDIVPGSRGAAAKQSLVDFCNDNYDFVHRFDGGGLTLKK